MLNTVDIVAKTATSGSLASSYLFDAAAGVMSQIYGMLNAQQLLVFMPMFENLIFPTNAELINAMLLNVSTFSWIPTETVNTELYGLP